MDDVVQLAHRPPPLTGQSGGVDRSALIVRSATPSGESARRGRVQRLQQFLGRQVCTLPDLERGQRVESQTPSVLGGFRRGAVLPHSVSRIGMQLEHAEHVAGRVSHIPIGAVGAPRPVVAVQFVGKRQQPVIFGSWPAEYPRRARFPPWSRRELWVRSSGPPLCVGRRVARQAHLGGLVDKAQPAVAARLVGVLLRCQSSIERGPDIERPGVGNAAGRQSSARGVERSDGRRVELRAWHETRDRSLKSSW